MKAFRIVVKAIAFTALLAACTEVSNDKNTVTFSESENASYEMMLASDVDWTYLNPARKDKAPMAGTLWGDRNATDPTGFLLKPKNGFESPPHIHNVSYRGIVISGFIHNDDPNAENMWMSTASFWTQPKGEVHITSAKSDSILAYIEIEEGPYLVHHADEAFHTDERAVNVHKSNIVWLDASDIKWLNTSGEQAQENEAELAFLWEETAKQLSGNLIKLPAGFKGEIKTEGKSFRAVVIKGQPSYKNSGMEAAGQLPTGSYFGSKENAVHALGNEGKTDVILYVRAEGTYNISSTL